MICKNCGCQIADDSSFCINCGAAVEIQSQPQYQQQPQYPQYQQPQYAPQPQYIVQQPYAYEPPMPREYTQYLDSASSAMSRAITSLALTVGLFWLYGAGLLIGFIMSLTVKGTLGKLKRRELSEEELITQNSREKYASAKRKARTASILSTINLVLVLIPAFVGVIAGVIAAAVAIFGSY